MVVQGYNYMSGTRTANYDESITTPVYGIVFTSWEHVSVYANRIEGLAQGPVSPLVAGTRRVIGGVDWDVPGLQGVALNGRMLYVHAGCHGGLQGQLPCITTHGS